jgi:hypothetical protein
MVKILEQPENQKSAMMDSSHEWQSVGSSSGVTGLVNQELLLQNEYLAAENRILRAHLPARLRLSDPERCTLAEVGKRLGRKAARDSWGYRACGGTEKRFAAAVPCQHTRRPEAPYGCRTYLSPLLSLI